LIRDNSKRTQQ